MRQQNSHDTEQNARADNRPPVPAVIAILFLTSHRQISHRQIESVGPSFEEDVTGVLFFALPEDFSECGFVSFCLAHFCRGV